MTKKITSNMTRGGLDTGPDNGSPTSWDSALAALSNQILLPLPPPPPGSGDVRFQFSPFDSGLGVSDRSL